MKTQFGQSVVVRLAVWSMVASPLVVGDDGPVPPTFTRHVVDDDIQALGADIGDRTRNSMADIVAVDRSSVYWYARGEKHLIDRLETPANFLLVRTPDVDRDGDADAIAVDHTGGNIFYYENPGDPSLKARRWPRHVVDDRVRGAHAVAIGDIDRDGRPDVVASGEAECDVPDTIFWYRCPDEPNTAERWERYAIGPGQSGGLAHYPGIGDVNGDGRLDVVHAAKNDTPRPDRNPPVKKGEWYRMWIQPEDPRTPWIYSEVGVGYRQATNIQVADVNGDGITDLIATQGHHVGLLWFEGPHWRPRYVDRTLKSPHSLAVADIDVDGDTDFATCAFESRVLAWFANNGQGGFERHDIHTDQEAYDLVARDVDGDGDLDLVVAGRGSRNVVWYEQVRQAPKRRAPGQSGGIGEDEARAAPRSKEAELREFAMTESGDPTRGERLFMTSERLSCVRCHAVGAPEGGPPRGGPDLAGIGSKYSRDELIRSILRPSDFVLPGYETTVLVTRDGQAHQGVLGAVEAEALVLVDASGASWPVPLADIVKRTTTGSSFMPQDLLEEASPEEFADLVAYLETLKQDVPESAVARGVLETIERLERPIELRPFLRRDITFLKPVWFGVIPGFEDQFLVLEQEGRIWRVEKRPDGELKTLFLDLSYEVSKGAVEGLMCIAFHPDFTKNGKYYLKHEVRDDVRLATTVVERRASDDRLRDSGKPSRELIAVEQPAYYHNGGCLAFGPDGYLYIAMGDGGPQRDPTGNSQSLRVFHGAMLRIDVDSRPGSKPYGIPASNPFLESGESGLRPEIWAIGLREPWRFSFDPLTGDLWVGDVGQIRYEEVTIVRAGENHGWNVYEGFEPFSERYRRREDVYTPPVIAYARQLGVSITGGHVYRGNPDSSFYGVYIFGDYESRRIWGVTQTDRKLLKIRELGVAPARISSFGLDARGEIHLVGFDGVIYRLELGGTAFE